MCVHLLLLCALLFFLCKFFNWHHLLISNKNVSLQRGRTSTAADMHRPFRPRAPPSTLPAFMPAGCNSNNNTYALPCHSSRRLRWSYAAANAVATTSSSDSDSGSKRMFSFCCSRHFFVLLLYFMFVGFRIFVCSPPLPLLQLLLLPNLSYSARWQLV